MGVTFDPNSGAVGWASGGGSSGGISIGDTIGGTPADGGILYADSSDTLRANKFSIESNSYFGGLVTTNSLADQASSSLPRIGFVDATGAGGGYGVGVTTNATAAVNYLMIDVSTLSARGQLLYNPSTPANSNFTIALANGLGGGDPELAITTTAADIYVPLDMNSEKITGLATPTASTDASTKAYVDGIIPSQTGNSGKFLTTNGSAVSWGTVSATPGGSDTQVQFNNSGAFGASSSFVWDGTRVKSNSGFRMNSGSSNNIGDSDGNGAIYFDGNSVNIYGYSSVNLRDWQGQYAILNRGGAMWDATAIDTGPLGGGNYDTKMVFSGGQVNTYDGLAFATYFGGKVGAQANNEKLYGAVFRPQFAPGSYTGLTKIGTIFVTPDSSSLGMIVKGSSSQSVDMFQIRNSSDTVLASFGSGGNLGIGGAATSTSKLNIQSIPTSSAGLATGDVWSDSGTLKIV